MCLLTSRQVILVGAVHFLGGMMIRMPLWRLPLMEPPLASTMKLTRNLMEEKRRKLDDRNQGDSKVSEEGETGEDKSHHCHNKTRRGTDVQLELKGE